MPPAKIIVLPSTIFLAYCLVSQVGAQSAISSEMVRLSNLSVAAMQCSLVAPSESENARLLDIGIESGRKFYELIRQSPEEFKEIWVKIPGPYLRKEGPSVDVLVGRVYGIVGEEMFRLEAKSPDTKPAFMLKEYISRSCKILRL